MMYTIPLEQAPNQYLSTNINGKLWNITLETRLGKLYASFNDELYNRVCQNANLIHDRFFFLDIEGNDDPQWEQLGTRYKLVWWDGLPE